MTRFELLWLLIGQARANGFEFRRWYVKQLGLPWQSSRHATEMLSAERRYYALLFSHEFAQHFWKAGEKMTFLIEKQTFQRIKPDGTIGIVHRKGYTRRSGREDAWRYHLKEVALAEEPLRYMRRYLRIEEDLEDDTKSETTPILHAVKPLTGHRGGRRAAPGEAAPLEPGVTEIRVPRLA